jgi:hypothetical protein
MSSQTGKDVIYIDIDDEITTIIDKVRSSQERIVALVLPKRATVFQSIVNMKLLKRTADTAKKHLVLITSETGLMPLAGAVGVHVAKSLQSKPEVPTGPQGRDETEDEEELADMADEDEQPGKLDASRPVGEHARSAAPSVANPLDAEDDIPIELDNAAPASAAAAGSAAKKAGSKSKRLKIPDFNKFRLLTVLGAAGLVVIILLWYVGFVVMPKASVVVKTDSTAVDANIDMTFKTDAEETDVDAGIVPAKMQQVQKTASEQAPATGQKDKGTKASGEVTIKNCGADEVTIPAGTAVSAGGLTFITQSRVDLDDGKFGGVCKGSGEHIATVDVAAQQGGEQYNLEPRSDYRVAGQAATVTANGSQMTGGTSNIVKVIAQADIDGAHQKISAQNTDATKTELLTALQAQGLYVIDGTFATGTPEVTTSAPAGTETDTVTVTQKTTYSMLGAKESDLKKLIANTVNEEIDPQQQSILDYGLDDAVFKMQNQQGTETLTTLEVTAVAGSDLNLEEIKEQIAGKKANDAKEVIGEYPGVTEVTVDYSPFWVSSIPKKTSKITVTVEKPSPKK